MTPETQKYYEELFNTFNTPGWELILQKFTDLKVQYESSGWGLPTEELAVNKGRMDILLWLVNFQKSHEEAYEQISEAEAIEEGGESSPDHY